MDTDDKKNQKLEVTLDTCDAEIGKSYPIYGSLTNVWQGVPGMLIAEIEHSTIAVIMDADEKFAEDLKKRLFEPGIFVSKVLLLEQGRAVVRCSRVFFSRLSDTQH